MTKLSFDAGHGKHTPGKRSPAGEREWVFNDKLVREAMNYLENYYVELKRVDDPTGEIDVSLDERIDRINDFGSDFHSSFHNNALSGEWGNHGGTETYVHNYAFDTSKEVARKVQDAVVNVLDTVDRGNKDADFRILESNTSSCLVEFLFMDSREDIIKLRNDALLKKAGEAVAKVLVEHFNLKRKSKGGGDMYYRLKTGYFENARELANAIDKARGLFSWNFHERADSTNFDPHYRIYTGRFDSKNEAENAADDFRSKTGWNVYVIEA